MAREVDGQILVLKVNIYGLNAVLKRMYDFFLDSCKTEFRCNLKDSFNNEYVNYRLQMMIQFGL